MVKRSLEQLAVYQVEEETESLSLSSLRSLYIEKTSEIVYINKGNKLYGIICMGEALQANQIGNVIINKSFTLLPKYNIVKAHEIFRNNSKIHKIPIVNEDGKLIGDYSRWDDMLYIERNHSLLMKEKAVKKALRQYKVIYVIEPVEKNYFLYLELLEYLKCFQIKYEVIDKVMFAEQLTREAVYICLNEDERRGIQCLYGIVPCFRYNHQYDGETENEMGLHIITYKNLLVQIMKNNLAERLGINQNAIVPYDNLDEKATILLSALQARGIKCFCLYGNEKNVSEYRKRISSEVVKRLRRHPLTNDKPWPQKSDNKEFYGELYQLEDYDNEIAQREIREGILSFEYRNEISGKYFNAKNGRRATCFQPQNYIGTIYFLGPCTMIGGYVEDQYTIESYLQKILLDNIYCYRVENYAGMLRYDSGIDSRLEEIGQYSSNDIVIYLLRSGETEGIEGSSLEKMFEKNQICSEWISDMDLFFHCNHKANKMIAQEIFNMIEPYIVKGEEDKKNKERIDICEVMKEYIRNQYLEQYFSDFNNDKYHTIGAIVMNCNPFSKGHRYLIEQACQRVECLIVFVVEEDASLFPFEERFRLVKEGTRDLKNVLVVPSGDFILSKNNFRQYFSKLDDGAIACNAEYDIHVFADYIAKPLGIRYRFVGDEPEDRVTGIYNEIMEKVLPQKGIEFVKFQRIMTGNEVISASKIRNYLKEMEYYKAFSMMTNAGKEYLMQQIG